MDCVIVWIRPISQLTLWISQGLTQALILNLRGEIPRRIGDLPDNLSQAMLVEIILVGRLGVSKDSTHRCSHIVLCKLYRCSV